MISFISNFKSVVQGLILEIYREQIEKKKLENFFRWFSSTLGRLYAFKMLLPRGNRRT